MSVEHAGTVYWGVIHNDMINEKKHMYYIKHYVCNFKNKDYLLKKLNKIIEKSNFFLISRISDFFNSEF